MLKKLVWLVVGALLLSIAAGCKPKEPTDTETAPSVENEQPPVDERGGPPPGTGVTPGETPTEQPSEEPAPDTGAAPAPEAPGG
jgi:hypothetical protein